MNCSIRNNTNKDFSDLTQMIEVYFTFAQKKMGFNKPVNIALESDLKNAADPLGKTAYYDPSNYEIVIYVDNRHPKDIMRSLSHELVHHSQNCKGQFKNMGPAEEGYAQNNPHLRAMEKDAFLNGNIIFRDWCDTYHLNETIYKNKGDNKMKLTENVLRDMIREAFKEATLKRSEKAQESTEEISEKEDATLEENDEDKGESSELKEEEEELEEGGAADRPENKDKHVAEPDRGQRVHLEEDEEPLKEWFDSSLYNKLIKEYTRRKQ